MKRLTTIACVGVIGASVAGSYVIGPIVKPGHATPTSVVVASSLPSTGARRTQFAIAQQATPAEIYMLELPPPPAPAPAPTPPPAPAPRVLVAARPWTPPPGYATINVPIYQQAMVLDCETSALRMGLATFGHYYSDAALFAQENPDTRSPVMAPNHTVVRWGNPYTNFVGQVNGSDYTPTGYGVYWPVILSIARSHGDPGASGGEGLSSSSVYHALLTGHPVEVWVETNWARPTVRAWTAWDGRTVRYSFVEHAVTLSGVSQTQVRVNDPLHGTQYWISKSLFEANWSDFNNMAVIF